MKEYSNNGSPEGQKLLRNSLDGERGRSEIDVDIATQLQDKQYLKLVGAVISMSASCCIAFSILISLKLDGIINWTYWIVFSPVFLALFVLLVLTQSRTLTQRFPLISRLAWLMSVISVIAFTVMVILKLEKLKRVLKYEHVFTPLYVMFSSVLILGVAGVLVAVVSRKSRRRSKYLSSALPLLLLVIFLFPFILLLEFKLEYGESTKDKNIIDEKIGHQDIGWTVVFIPLFIADGFFFCISAFLTLFTVGARESALFSISQLLSFLLSVPAAVTFKILLIVALNGSDIPVFGILAPIFVAEILILTCGLNMLVHNYKKEQTHSNQSSHNKIPI